ncbi:MAG TPA: hypothetical protein VGH76_02340 [Actinomycetospora sp.]|uniref:hypothetical protein n=1 Tax=Actinomycetospora sp. TaxID=1872135 RepID=UPI002F428A41
MGVDEATPGRAAHDADVVVLAPRALRSFVDAQWVVATKLAAREAFRDEIAQVRDRLVELSRIEERLTEELLS